MLNIQYKNALSGFKAQANGTPPSFEGCEAEVQHIYRIIMTEKISVVEIDEAMIEKFLIQEAEGKSDYSKYVDHDGLRYVDIEKDVEIYPYAGQRPIAGETYRLPSLDAKTMLGQLVGMGKLSLITDTLQSLCQRQDGTKLQTAFPDLSDVKACISSGLILPMGLVEKINVWEAMNCSEINFDFEELKSNDLESEGL
jgi:hypothetical protein